jgi:hypothetical protein
MPFPQIRACVVCEGVRPEVLGKYTLLGLLGLAPDVQINIANFALPVTLCFVFLGGEGSGSFHVAMRVTTPSGATLPGLSEGDGELAPGKPTSVVFMQFQDVLPGPGRYTVVLAANGQDVYRTGFVLAQGDAQDMLRKQQAS